MINRICVFCGSSDGNDPVYVQAAQRLGAALVEREIALVYGGAKVGLMGAVADQVLAGGGEVIGVIPQSIAKLEVAHNGLSDLRVVDSMHERKALMMALSDGFIAMPGGLGTLEELFEVLTWLQLGFHSKPCGLLNVNQYFGLLKDFLNHMAISGFAMRVHLENLLINENTELLLGSMERFVPASTPKLG